MADFIIRPALPEDFPSIRALIHVVKINPTGLDWHHFLVAVTPENKLLGCGQIKPHYDGSLELASIAVQEQARGQGVARAVIQELLLRETTRPLYFNVSSPVRIVVRKIWFPCDKLGEYASLFPTH